mmetsp:Transcript_54373/g.140087  ORF Transcript_54373/g.140087 Transcript_54373/m.140087 type:complete len:348 (+) Transcript_54373:151-1194(+)
MLVLMAHPAHPQRGPIDDGRIAQSCQLGWEEVLLEPVSEVQHGEGGVVVPRKATDARQVPEHDVQVDVVAGDPVWHRQRGALVLAVICHAQLRQLDDLLVLIDLQQVVRVLLVERLSVREALRPLRRGAARLRMPPVQQHLALHGQPRHLLGQLLPVRLAAVWIPDRAFRGLEQLACGVHRLVAGLRVGAPIEHSPRQLQKARPHHAEPLLRPVRVLPIPPDLGLTEEVHSQHLRPQPLWLHLLQTFRQAVHIRQEPHHELPRREVFLHGSTLRTLGAHALADAGAVQAQQNLKLLRLLADLHRHVVAQGALEEHLGRGPALAVLDGNRLALAQLEEVVGGQANGVV